MIEEIRTQLDEIIDLVISGQATKTVIVKKLRNIQGEISNYFSSHEFQLKDMKIRQVMYEVISSLIDVITEAEKTILKMQVYDHDQILDILMSLKAEILKTLSQIHVIGQAKPIILDLKKEIEKRLKKETIKVPENVEKYGEETITLYRVLRLAPIKEYSIKELVELTNLPEELVEKAIKNLEKEGYIEILYRGDKKVVRWTQ